VREPAPIFFGVVDADGRLHLEAIAAYRRAIDLRRDILAAEAARAPA